MLKIRLTNTIPTFAETAVDLLFIFNALPANLRHSHAWLSFGHRLEHVINSPAQHQIHHSNAPRHFNKNFATNLSLRDWMFGSLYTTQATPEAIRFGTGAQDIQHYLTLYSLIIAPFVRTACKPSPSGFATPGKQPGITRSAGCTRPGPRRTAQISA